MALPSSSLYLQFRSLSKRLKSRKLCVTSGYFVSVGQKEQRMNDGRSGRRRGEKGRGKRRERVRGRGKEDEKQHAEERRWSGEKRGEERRGK